MKSPSELTISYLDLENYRETQITEDSIVDVSWPEFVDILSGFIRSDDKDRTACYSPVQMKPFNQWIYKKKHANFKEMELTLPPVADVEALGFSANHFDSENVANEVDPQGLLARNGFKDLDRIHMVNGELVSNWKEIETALTQSTTSKNTLTVRRNSGSFRVDENVEAISFIVLDLDADGAYEKAESFFAGFERVVHSTSSYGPGFEHKLRMVIPMESPIPVEEWGVYFDKLQGVVNSDAQCSNESRIYNFPMMSPSLTIPPRFDYHSGRLISHAELQKKLGLEGAELTTSKYEHREDKTPVVGVNGKLRHKFESVLAPSYSLAALMDRHQDSLRKLEEERMAGGGGRDMFSYRVINDELDQYGDKADIPNLIYFMVEACNPNKYSYSSIGLDHPDSDTAAVDNLTNKFQRAIGRIDYVRLTRKYPDVQGVVEAAVNTAMIECKHPTALEERLNNADNLLYGNEYIKSKLQHALAYDYKSIYARNGDLIDAFESGSIDKQRFVKQFVVDETKAAKNGLLNFQHTIQFMYRYFKENQNTLLPSGAFSDAIGRLYKHAIDHYAPEMNTKVRNVEMIVSRMCERNHNIAQIDAWSDWEPDTKKAQGQSSPSPI